MSYDKDCPRCGGSGQIQCHDPRIPLDKCRKCHGTGYKNCNRCNGTGKVAGKSNNTRR